MGDASAPASFLWEDHSPAAWALSVTLHHVAVVGLFLCTRAAIVLRDAAGEAAGPA